MPERSPPKSGPKSAGGRATRTAKRLGSTETFQQFATRVMIEAMRLGGLSKDEVIARMKPQEILIERNFLLGQSADSLAAQLAFDHWADRETCTMGEPVLGPTGIHTRGVKSPAPEIHVLDRRGGITAIVRELTRDGGKVQSRSWFPGSILKENRAGKLVETETSADGTITACYRVPGYGYRVVAKFDGRTGRRID